MTPEEAKQQYDQQGYVLIRSALTPEELQRLRTAFDRAAEKKALQDLLNQDDVFVDMVDHPVLLTVVRAVVGDDAQLRYAHGGIVRPGDENGSGWHCDLSGMLGVYLPESVIMTKLFTYLEDVPESGACLAFVPGSHRYDLGHPLPDIATHEAMPHHVKMVVRAGDAVLMNGYTWHARFHNRSDRPRKVLEYSYIHSWMKTMYDFRALSSHVQELIMASHNRRQLFGVPEPGRSDWERRFEEAAPYRSLEVGV
jgi:ectoine hydroxylase-related dioxygenase (phytanoyl-CoA dioxygenase family)